MKRNFLVLALLTLGMVFTSNAQEDSPFKERKNKGRVFLTYGLNRTTYDLSTLSLTGNGYDFKLHNFRANDNFSKPDFALFNAKLGIFLGEKMSLSLGFDQMKYHVRGNDLSPISGSIDSGAYAGQYYKSQDQIRMTNDLIKYDYSKLSYASLNFDVNDDFTVSKGGKSAWSYFFGIGGGVLLSESSVALFGDSTLTEGSNGLSGFAGNFNFGTRLHLFNFIFFELAGKAGYATLKDIPLDATGGLAKHNFMFIEGILSVGLMF